MPQSEVEELAEPSLQRRAPDALASALAEPVLPSLDGLRALAVMLVVLYHFGLPVNGGLGVTMFFTLSGFLITWLLLKEQQRCGNVSLRLFYVRRSLRIFPAFYCFWLLVVLGPFLLNKPVPWAHAVTSFFYIGNYYQAITGDWSTSLFHTWSLAIEEQFYLIWPFLFIRLRGNIQKFLLVAIPCFWAYRLTLVAAGVSQNYIYSALDARADHLLIGCALAAYLWNRQRSDSALPFAARTWKLLLLLGLLAASAHANTMFGWSYRNIVGFIVDPVLTAAIIAQALALRPSWLNWAPVRYVGRISYSVYLYHMIAMGVALKVLGDLPLAVRLAGSLAAIFVVASLSYYLIERPFLLLKDRFGHRSVGTVRQAAAWA